MCVINSYIHTLRHFKNSADTVSVGSTRTELHISALYVYQNTLCNEMLLLCGTEFT